MIELKYHKGRMLLPESFEELSGKQFAEVAALKFTGGDELKLKVKALRILSGLSYFRFAWLSITKPHVINNALPYVDWVFDAEQKATKQVLPCFKGYYGPASDFDNLRMKEFHLSELYFKEVVNPDNTNMQASLNNLVAVLYRLPKKDYDTKKDPDGDIRIDFNHNELPFYAKKVAAWPDKVKQAIFLWYAGCRQQLEDENPMVFANDSDFQSQFDTGMYGVMRSLAGDKLGPLKEIEGMYVIQCMLEIGMIKEEEKYFEEKLKQKTA